MQQLERWFYQLTAWWPRRLPQNDGELHHLKYVLRTAFDVPDTEQSWLTLCGQITSTPPNKIRRRLSEIVNAIYRMNRINPTVVTEKQRNIASLEAKLKAAADRVSAQLQSEEAEKAKTEKTSEIPLVEIQNGPASLN